MDRQPLMTAPQVAEWLGVKESTIRKWRFLGKIPFLKIGSAIRYDPEVIQRWFKTGECQTLTVDEERYNLRVR